MASRDLTKQEFLHLSPGVLWILDSVAHRTVVFKYLIVIAPLHRGGIAQYVNIYAAQRQTSTCAGFSLVPRLCT